MQSGLWSEKGRVPLISVGVKGKVRDYLCEVQVNHRYIHKGTEPIETTFKFPLDLFGALIGFSVTVDGKTVEAKITPRAKITEIGSPREALTVDEEEQPEFFECSISGVQPNKEVELELRYATELVVEHGASLRFILPSSVISPGSEENAEDKAEKTSHQLSIELDVELPEDFSVETPTHKDVIKQEQKRPHTSVITLNKESAHNEPSFVLLVNMKGSLQPWAAVSQHSAGGKAALLSFFPQFDIKRAGPSEILFIVDRSSTISTDVLQNVKEALQLFLRSLSSGVHFNIIAFGATFTKMSPSTVEYNQETLDMANQFVEKIKSEQGTSNLMAPLRDVFSTACIKDAPRQLFVITDGHVSNTQGIFSLIRKNANKTRVFSFGVGERVGHYLVTEMARAGYGEFEFVSDSEQLKDVFVRQLKRALQPALVEPHIDWGTLKVTQAPETLRAVFNGDRLFVYALLPQDIPSDATATFRAVMHDGRHVTFEAKLGTTSNGSNLINILAARNRIRDLEEVEEDKSREEITQLGMTYGLASKFTSFIAVVREQPVALHSSTSIPMDTLNESLITPKKKDDTSSNNTSGSNTPLNANSAAFVPRSSAVTIASPNKKTYTADFMQSLSKYYTDIPTHVNPEIRSLDIFSAFGSADNKNKQSIGQTVSTTKGRDSKPGHKRDTSTGGRSDLKKSGKSSLNASRENIALPPVAPLVHSDNRWIRPDAINAEVLSVEQLRRKALGILNKMTLEMFVPLSEQLYAIGFDTIESVDTLIDILFEKAMVEPHFSTMYATLCNMLAEKIKPFVEEEKTKDFKRTLISNCQIEFQNRKEKAKIDPALVGEEKEDAERLSKLKYLGTMKFIGELFKQGILAEKTMHTCINIMLEEISSGVDSSEDQFEGLVKFITTTGQLLESPQMKQPELMKSYFEQLQNFSTNMEFPSRVRFMLKDIIDLRENGWTPRRKGVEAKTLAEARADVEDNSSATPARNTSKTQPNTPASPAPASGKKQKEHRDKLIKSTSAIPRSVSHSSQDDEWETAGSSRKSRGGSKRDLHSSQNNWETVGGGGKGKGGRGRGGSKSNSRASTREETTKEEKKTLQSVRTNLFSALRDDDEDVSSPKIKTRSLAQSDFPVTRESAHSETRTVTFEKPARDVNEKTKVIYEEYLVSNDHEEALECVRELKLTEKETSIAVVQIYRVALEGRDKDRDLLHKLLISLLSDDQLTEDDLIEGFSSIATTIDDDDMDYPMASRYLGTFIGNMVANDKLSLAFLKSALSPIVETGKAIRVALVCLQAIQKDKGEEHCESLLNKSGLDLKRLMRKVDREGELLSQLLSKEGLENLSQKGGDVTTTTEDNIVEESRPRRQSVSSSVIDSIILQQSAEGFWNLDQRFADLLTARLGDLEPAIPEGIKDRTSLWATLLALAFLEGNYGSKKEKWGLVSKKAREWVDREVTEGRGQLQEDARSCLNDLDLFIA